MTCTYIFIAWHRATAAGVFAPSKSRLFCGESFFSAIFPLSQKAAPIPPIVVFAMRKLKFQTFMCAVIEKACTHFMKKRLALWSHLLVSELIYLFVFLWKANCLVLICHYIWLMVSFSRDRLNPLCLCELPWEPSGGLWMFSAGLSCHAFIFWLFKWGWQVFSPSNLSSYVPADFAKSLTPALLSHAEG